LKVTERVYVSGGAYSGGPSYNSGSWAQGNLRHFGSRSEIFQTYYKFWILNYKFKLFFNDGWCINLHATQRRINLNAKIMEGHLQKYLICLVPVK
jgi:hypothetical protein